MNLLQKTEDDYISIIQNAWRQWKFVVIVVVVLAISVVALTSYWNYYQTEVQYEQENIYSDTIVKLKQTEEPAVIESMIRDLLNQLADLGESGNSQAIKLELGSYAYTSGLTDFSVEIFSQLVSDNDPVSALAKLRLARIYLFDFNDAEKAESLLENVEQHWPIHYRELLGDIAAQQGNYELAAEQWQNALQYMQDNSYADPEFEYILKRKIVSWELVNSSVDLDQTQQEGLNQ